MRADHVVRSAAKRVGSKMRVKFLSLVALSVCAPTPSAATPFDDAVACYERVEIGALDEAIALCTSAIDAGVLGKKNLSVTANNRGRAHLRKNAFELAEDDFTRAIQHDEKNASAHNNRGAVRLLLRRFEEAEADFATAVALKPDYASAFYNRGVAREEAGDATGALEDFITASKLDPTLEAAMVRRDGLVANLLAGPNAPKPAEVAAAAVDDQPASPETAAVETAAEPAPPSAPDVEGQADTALKNEIEGVAAVAALSPAVVDETARAVEADLGADEAPTAAPSPAPQNATTPPQPHAEGGDGEPTSPNPITSGDYQAISRESATTEWAAPPAGAPRVVGFDQTAKAEREAPTVLAATEPPHTEEAEVSASAAAVDWDEIFRLADVALTSGDKDARQIQSELTKEGFNPGLVDGIYGPRTRQALRACFDAKCPVAEGLLAAHKGRTAR